MKRLAKTVLMICLLVSVSEVAMAQSGRLFSTYVRERGGKLVGDQYYLLSKKARQTEDASYVDGRIRIVSVGGPRTVKEMKFSARCAVHPDLKGSMPLAVTYDNFRTFEDVDPTDDTPSFGQRTSYNLWWAACYGQFNKL